MTTIIYRILSAIITIGIVIPLYFLKLLTTCLFNIFNDITFHNYGNCYVPVNEIPVEPKYFAIVKIVYVVLRPIVQLFFDFYYGLKAIKL